MKLSDFGLSKELNLRGTCSMSGLKGTVLWMAPELQVNNEANRATPKCDVFPCGCVFFVFLTRENGGIHPFGDKNDHLQIQVNIRKGKPVNMDSKISFVYQKVPAVLVSSNIQPITIPRIKTWSFCGCGHPRNAPM